MFMLSNADKFFYFLDNPHMFPTILGGDLREQAARMWKDYGADPAKFNSWWYNAYLKDIRGNGDYLPTLVDYTYFSRSTPMTEAMQAAIEARGPYRDPPRPAGQHQTGHGHLSSKCNDTEAVAFVHKYKKAAQTTADNLDVPLENILGLAASESRYGKPNPDGTLSIAVRDNNYFSMHALSGGQQYDKQHGVDISHAKNPKDRKTIAVFLSFDDNLYAFEKYWGPSVRGKKDPYAFGQALVDAKYNTERANFVNNLADVIDAVRARLQCPEI